MAIDRSVLLDAGGKPLRRPVVYLDQSTLVDAFEGKRGATGPNAVSNAELATVVEEAARTGTICISIIHVFELARRDHAVAMATWLGGLAPRWFQMDEAANEELANEVRRRLGMKCAPPGRLPIHHAMSAAYRSSLFKNPALARAALRILDCPDLASMIRRIHGDQRLMQIFKDQSASSVDFFVGVHADRSLIPKGTPMHADAERKVEAKVRKRVEDDACQLIARSDIDWARGESYPSGDAISAVVREALDDQDAIPLTKIGQQIAGNVADDITRQKARSGRFNERFKGFGWDSRHATAAAVVDVFTCDYFTDSVIGDFRTARGMERQISYLELDREAFVAELRRQCAEPSAAA
jgi:hypothetical protein